MATPPEELLEFYRAHRGAFADKGTPEEIYLAILGRLDAILDALRASPLAPYIRIFGSAATGGGLVPGDVDCLIEGPYGGLGADVRRTALAEVMRLTEGDNHGFLDPFLVVRKADGTEAFYARGDAVRDNGWIPAARRTAKAIKAAGRAGVPVAEYDRRFVGELGAAAQARTPAGP